MIADWFERREIATAMSVLMMSWPLGIMIGQIATPGWPSPTACACPSPLRRAIAL
jgi:hypothetical protein